MSTRRTGARTDAPSETEPATPTERYVASEVDEVLAAYADLLPESDLQWMRERLLESVRDDATLLELASSARPRSVDRSAELPTRALLPPVKKATRGGRR